MPVAAMPAAAPAMMSSLFAEADGFAVDSFGDWLMLDSLDEALPMGILSADELSFDHISVVLSRSVTPPPESLPPSPYNSSSSSPSESRCASPISQLFMDSLLDTPSTLSSCSSAFSSAPASPMAPTSRLQSRRKGDDSKIAKIKKIAKGEVAKASKRSKAVALATKRDSHNVSERNRRHELKLSFNLLQSIVPSLVNSSRAHTGTILKETIAYVVALRAQERELLESKSALLAEQSRLMMSV